MDAVGSDVNASALFQATPTYAAPQPASLTDVANTASNMELFEKFLQQAGAK